MRRTYMLAAGLILLAALAYAECPSTTREALHPRGYETVTVSSTAVGFTVPAGASMAVFRVETANVRMRDDGTDPTSTVGTLIESGLFGEVCTGSLSPVRFIRVTGDATLGVSYYGR